MPEGSPGNMALASKLAGIAQMLELAGADKFRIVAHERAARMVEGHPQDLCKLALEKGKPALLEIHGIGPKIADKIIEFATTGRIAEHDQLAQEGPPGLMDMLRIPGLGPKTVRTIWQEKGVTDLAGLKKIIDDGSIMDVPRMGAKTVENIKAALAFTETEPERIPLGVAMMIADDIIARMRRVSGVTQAEFAGSLRRGRETIGDIDILVAAVDPASAREAFTKMPEVTQVLAAGETKSSVRLYSRGKQVQADLRIVPEASWGAALLYFTGAKEHNVRLRERALRRGHTLNEYGLYIEDKAKTPPQQRGIPAVAGRTEEEIFEKLGVPFVPPELREERDIDRSLPIDLITVADIKAELHAHTTASDGKLTITELVDEARKRGFHTIAITDHSQSSAIAGGLKPDELRRHIEAVRAFAAETKDMQVLAGSEVDILPDGSLDYEDELLAQLDIVVASPHASLRQDAKAATARLLRAVKHPLVHILGHPTGRLINRREGVLPDIEALAAAAAEHRTALEINANWRRLDLRDVHVRIALSVGGARTLIAIDCDSHSVSDFDNLRYGVMTARRAGLPRSRCVNTWDRKKLRDWLRSKR